MTQERKKIISVSEEESRLLTELATLKEKLVTVAGEIQSCLDKFRRMDYPDNEEKHNEIHQQLNRLNMKSHTINNRCNEIYKRLQVLTKNKTAD